MPHCKPSRKHLSLVVALLVAGLASQITACQRLDPNSPVAQRRKIFKDMTKAREPLLAFAKGKQAFDPEAAIRDAQQLQKLSRLPWPLFPEVHQANAGDTKGNAQSAVWGHPEQFQLRVEEFQRSADALATASQGRSLEQLRPAVKTLEQSCQRCHDQFRKM